MNTSVTYLEEQIQRSLIAIRKLKEENSRLKENHGKEPIAVIGMSCKFPGGTDSISKFWKSLMEGKDLISELPDDRWNTDKFYHPNKDNEGTYYTKYGGVLKRNLKEFDPVFFNISPLEAKYMDPQQRLLLEATWEVFENANYGPASFHKSETGVFIGIASIDNAIRLHQSHAPISAYTGTGNTLSGGAGRIAHVFGLKGPVMSIDTACSSSLVALHQACQSIRNKECSTALVGGVNVLLSPDVMVNFCQSNMLAQDGRCKTFDESANGYSRGEGVGMVMLKPFSEALKDGDSILALIKGSAINHDGRSAGLTVPNGFAQQSVIEKALEDASLKPEQIGYVECHGTGTSLGDPIEFEAIANTYGKRDPGNVLHIGSLKTNIGHLEAAAGVAGLIKLILCLRNKEFVSHLHINQPSSHIPWEKFPQIKLTNTGGEWNLSAGQKSRIAGISSFGFTGTNAHVVVEEYVNENENFNSISDGFQVLTLSAKSAEALGDLKTRYVDYLEGTKESLTDVMYSSNIGREHFTHRLAIVGSSTNELINNLKLEKGIDKKNDKIPAISFLFTGQGAQYKNMGIELYKSNSFFRSKIDECDGILKNELSISLHDLLFNSDYEEQIHQTEYSQPVIFAIEYALASLWKYWGVEPKVLLGHSIGELVAACFAGVFTLEDGLKVVAARGRFMQNAPGNGVMYGTNLSGEQLQSYTEAYSNISVAAYNSSKQSVISGAKKEVEKVVSQLEKEGVLARKLQVSHAFHSPLMESAKEKFHKVLKSVKFNKPTIPILSNVNGKIADDEILTPTYWSDQLTNPVHFTACVKELSNFKIDTCIEVGPTPILLSLIANTIDDYPELIPTLNKNESAIRSISKVLTLLYNQGVDIDWGRVHKGVEKEKVLLPNYPFQLKEYWIEGEGFDVGKMNAVSRLPKVYKAEWKLKEYNAQELNKFSDSEWLLIECDQDGAKEFQTALSAEFGDKINRVQLSVSHENLNPKLIQILKGCTKKFNCIIFPGKEIDNLNSYSNAGFNFIELIKQFKELNKLPLLDSFTVLSKPGTSSILMNGFEVLSQVFENEFEYTGVNRIQLQNELNKVTLNATLKNISSNVQESIIRVSDKERQVKRLEQIELFEKQEESIFDKDKSYLITGGTGALGRGLVNWAIDNDAKHLVLLSRSGKIDKEIAGAYKKLKESGIVIEILKVDISDKVQVEEAIAKFGTKFPQLDGVFHLGGQLSDGLIINQSESQFKDIQAPKVDGSIILGEATKMMDLKFYVQFSSISSILGTPGQSNYAYANAFMDSLCEDRLNQGLPCLNINWGPWFGSGMADQVSDKSFELIEKIHVNEGFDVLSRLLNEKCHGNYVVGTIDMTIAKNENLAIVMPTDLPDIIEKEVFQDDKANINSAECTIDHIHRIIADIIELPLNQLETDVSIINYGFDSLLALKTQNKIRKDFGVDIDASEFMKNPSIKDLHAIVAQAHSNNLQPIKEEMAAADLSEKSLDDIDQLTEEEIDKLLNSLN